jgi:8-oxo-dGTP pyrophosphatase MutT (NUDIX family)
MEGEHTQEQEEWSAGIILYRRGQAGREYLLLKYEEGHWGFPKGQIEREENLKEAACRELREETEISSVRLIPGFQGLIEYGLEREGLPTYKRVIYFLGETEEKEVPPLPGAYGLRLARLSRGPSSASLTRIAGSSSAKRRSS